MAIKWGSTWVSVVKWGNTVCTQVKWGNTKVYPDEVVIFNGSNLSTSLIYGFTGSVANAANNVNTVRSNLINYGWRYKSSSSSSCISPYCSTSKTTGGYRNNTTVANYSISSTLFGVTAFSYANYTTDEGDFLSWNPFVFLTTKSKYSFIGNSITINYTSNTATYVFAGISEVLPDSGSSSAGAKMKDITFVSAGTYTSARTLTITLSASYSGSYYITAGFYSGLLSSNFGISYLKFG